MRKQISKVVGKIKNLWLLPSYFQVANDELKNIIQVANHDLKVLNDDLKILMGVVQSEAIINKSGYQSLAELEFKVFSQFGDDGIIQYLAHNVDLRNKTFIEFGVEDYFESNTRFLLQKDN